MANKILAVCLDCGDTLSDEATEVKAENDMSLRADLIPGLDICSKMHRSTLNSTHADSGI